MKFRIFLLFLLLPVVVRAVDISNWDITMEIGETTVHTMVTIDYVSAVERTDYFVLAPITEVKVSGEKGELTCVTKKQTLGTQILCENILEKKIKFDFTAYKLIDDQGEMKMFSFPFYVTTPTENLTLTVKLPVGAALVEKERLEPLGLRPYLPDMGEQGSDGRRIFVRWAFAQPKLGTSIDAKVIYEKMRMDQTVIFGLILSVAALLIFFWLLTKKKTYDVILTVLTRDERLVMEMLIKSEKKQVDQREIVRNVDYSKSKITRIVQNLEKRGLIKTTRVGRNNRIELLEHRPERKQTAQQPKEAKKQEK